ncbi:MAG: hypothetical protein PVI86_12770 [Phycisphaerae bacterium]
MINVFIIALLGPAVVQQSVHDNHAGERSAIRRQMWDYSLVLARVVKTTEERPGIYKSTLKVLHAYSGPEWVDTTFPAYSADVPQEGNIGVPMDPRLEVGEKGIWAVSSRSVHNLQTERWEHGVIWPVRERDEARFAAGKALAKAIEELLSGDEAEDLRRLQDFARSPIAEVSGWAVTVLGELHDQASTDFVQRLLGEGKLPFPAQLAADAALSRNHDASWSGSPERLRLVKKWVKSDLGKDNGHLLIAQLGIMCQHKQFDATVLVELCRTMINNPHVPARQRQDALHVVCCDIARRSKDRTTEVLMLLADVLETSDDRDLRKRAANIVYGCVSLEKSKDRAMVQELARSIDDPELASILDKKLSQNGL